MSDAGDRFEIALTAVIRQTREEDLAALEWFGAFTHHRQVFRRTFEAQQRGEALMLLAEANRFPIGQAWIDFGARSASGRPTVWAVRVLEPLQGAGIGERLMAAAEQAAAARGCAELELTVEKANAAAQRFYRRLGWRVEGERQESYSYTTPEGRAVTHALDVWVLGRSLSEGGARPTRL